MGSPGQLNYAGDVLINGLFESAAAVNTSVVHALQPSAKLADVQLHGANRKSSSEDVAVKTL